MKGRYFIAVLLIAVFVVGFVCACETTHSDADFESFDVIFYVGDEVYHTIEVDSADFDLSSAMPEEPQKKADENASYEFACWTYADGTPFFVEDKLSGETKLYASFDTILTGYTVEFIDWDGSRIPVDGKLSQTVKKGESAKAPEEPYREGYTFTGWDRAFDNIQKRTTVYATYSINEYTLTFVSDSEQVASYEVEYGADISAYLPVLSDKDGLEFAGWLADNAQDDGAMPAEDVTFNAVWKIKAPIVTLSSDVGKDGIVYGDDAVYSLSFTKYDGFGYVVDWYVDKEFVYSGETFTLVSPCAGEREVYAVLTVSADGAEDIQVKSVTDTLSVAKRTLTLTPYDCTLVYGEEFKGVSQYAFEGFKDGEDESSLEGILTFASTYKAGDGVGNYVVMASGLSSDNYDIIYKSSQLTVGKRPLTVMPDDKIAVYGDAAPAYTFSIGGLAACDTPEELGTAVYSCDYAQGDDAGIYAIEVSKGYDGEKIVNYEVDYLSAQLIVDKKEINVCLAGIDYDLVFGEDVPVFALQYDTLVGDDGLQDLGAYEIVTDYEKYSRVGSYEAKAVFDNSSLKYEIVEGQSITFNVVKADILLEAAIDSKNGQGEYWSFSNVGQYVKGLPAGFSATGEISLNTDVEGTYTCDGVLGEHFVWSEPFKVSYGAEDYTDCFELNYALSVTLNDSVSLIAVNYTGDYDGSAHGAYVDLTEMPEGATVEYLDGGEWKENYPTFTDAGEYVVNYRVQNGGIVVKEGTLSVRIYKIANELTVDSDSVKTYTYDGTMQTVDGFSVNAHENPVISYANNTFVDVPENGILEVKIIAGETKNYLSTETTQLVVINKANYTKAPATVFEVNVAHDKTLADYSAPAYFRWLDEGDNLSTVLRAGENKVYAVYNGDPVNYNDLITEFSVTGLKSEVAINAADGEVNVNGTWEADAYVMRDGIKIVADDVYNPVLLYAAPDTSYGTTYAVTYTLEENDFYYAAAKTVYVKVKSVLYGNVLYTIEDALYVASGNTVVVTADTSFADPAYGIYQGASYYTLKENTTLLVPYDSTHSTNTNNVTNTIVSTNLNKAYVTLTVPRGVNLVCNNSNLFVLAIRNSGSTSTFTGSANGSNYGALDIQEGAKIEINGGTFESTGYTYGDGEVYVYSGNVYEPMIMSGYKGGNITNAIHGDVFPVNQYIIANITVNLYVYSGVKYYAKSCVWLNSSSVNADIGYISTESSSFIQLTSGRIIKSYDKTRGVTKFAFEGNANINDMSMKIAAGLMSVIVTTEDKQVPFNGYFDFDILSGSVVNSSVGIKILPGCSVTVEKGATLNLNNGGNVFVYSADSNVSYDKSDRYESTPLVEGWQDGGNNMAYPYPSSHLLIGKPAADFNVSTAGELIIGGTFNVNSGASVAGVVTALEGGKLVLNSSSSTSLTITEDYSNSGNTSLIGFVRGVYFTSSNILLGRVNGASETPLSSGSTYVGDAQDNWVKQ